MKIFTAYPGEFSNYYPGSLKKMSISGGFQVEKLLIKLIRFYQLYISPLKPPSCRFYPTCSEYARQALGKYGVWKGLLLTAGRLLRCHPFCRGGYDPIR